MARPDPLYAPAAAGRYQRWLQQVEALRSDHGDLFVDRTEDLPILWTPGYSPSEAERKLFGSAMEEVIAP